MTGIITSDIFGLHDAEVLYMDRHKKFQKSQKAYKMHEEMSSVTDHFL